MPNYPVNLEKSGWILRAAVALSVVVCLNGTARARQEQEQGQQDGQEQAQEPKTKPPYTPRGGSQGRPRGTESARARGRRFAVVAP